MNPHQAELAERGARLLPVLRVSELQEEGAEQRWLVEGLWGREAVGVIGGAPKCCKSWLGLDIALSVASGTRALGHYEVRDVGPALIYLAEDALAVVRERADGIARQRGLELSELDVYVITKSTLRLDDASDRERLKETIRSLRPRLLLLDPLVRLHSIDENNAGEIAKLLAFLRELQRSLGLAVILVHHARKAGGVQAGQALRGSSDIHAFGDSNLYLRRRQDRLVLTVEHRAAPAPSPVSLELASGDERAVHLEVVATDEGAARSERVEERLLTLLAGGVVLKRAELREELSVRNETLGEVISRLEERALIERTAAGFRLVEKG